MFTQKTRLNVTISPMGEEEAIDGTTMREYSSPDHLITSALSMGLWLEDDSEEIGAFYVAPGVLNNSIIEFY